MKVKCLFFCLGLIGAFSAAGQQAGLYFEKISDRDGLSHNRVNCILQDQRGFIWIGTNDGLNRYDGQNFVIFRNQPGVNSCISGNIITDLVEDKAGILWIATADGGLSRYDYRLPPAQQFRQYKHQPGDTSSIPVNIVNTLVEDRLGYLWLGTGGAGVLRMDKTTGTFEAPVKKGTRTILSLCVDQKGLLWAGRQGGGWLQIDPSTLTWKTDERYANLYAKLPHAAITAMYADAGNHLWMGSWDNVLYRRDPATGAEVVFEEGKGTHQFINDEIDAFAADSLGRIWMGGHYAGLHLYDTKTGRFVHYRYDASREGSIGADKINCIYIDRSGVVWIGTDRGVSINYPMQQQFIQTFLPHTSQTGDEILIYDFFMTAANDLWVATSAGIYTRRAGESQFVFHPIIHKGRQLATTCFFKDIDGSLYLGTDFSLFRMDPQTFSIELLPHTEEDAVMNKIIDSRVVSVVRDTIEGHPVLLVSPYGHYLAYYDLVSQHWVSRLDTTRKIIANFKLQDNLIRKFVKTSSGSLWLAQAKWGLGCWQNGATPQVGYYRNDPAKKGSISNNNVFDIAEDDNGNLWVSTYGGGLNYFDTHERLFTHVAATNNLLEGLQVDEDGFVWMISNGNLHRYDPVKHSYASFDLPDLEKTGGVRGYLYQDLNGRLYAPGINFFIEYNPHEIHDTRKPPQVFLTEFTIFNQSNSDLLNNDTITLQYTQDYFSFTFAAPDYSAGDVVFAYQLEGWDNDWIETGTRNFAQFSNLAGGTYTFRVKATNHAGTWEGQPVAITVVIIPPFWKRWWFMPLIFLLIALIVYGIYRYRINELLKRQAMRNKIARDLHDHVGSTLSSVSVYSQVAGIHAAKGRQEALQDVLQKISTSSTDMISEMSDIVWAINPRNDSMEKILQRMESFARPLTAAVQVAFDFGYDQPVLQAHLDMEKRKNFYLIYKEAINNALKYADCSRIGVFIKLKGRHIIMDIEDDGKGFDTTAVQEHSSKSLSGNGLRNMERRATDMKGQLAISSVPEQGTHIRLNFSIT